MSLFGSKGRRHIDGHKDLTKHQEIISLVHGENMPKEVYFPTMSPNGKPITYTVKEGDSVKVGTKIGTRTDFYVPIYSSVSGTVKAQKIAYSPQVGRPIQHVVIENDGQYVEEELLKTVTLESSQEEIFEAIKEAGLVGMGGAGFPTYIKYNNPKNIETLLVNAVECEPFLTTDFVSMQQQAETLVLGCEYLMKASGANNTIIAIKVHKEEARDAVLAVLDGHPNVTVVEVPDQYPMGWERTLIKQVFKKEYDRLPCEIGVVVNNVQTVIELARTLSTGKTVSTRLVTVSGDGIASPCNIWCPIGTPAKTLIDACGGYTAEDVNNDVKQFSWADYKLCGDSSSTLTKYNNNSSYGTVDNLTTLELSDDAAYASDNTCRMPTKADFEELTANTTSTWETLNGVNGIRFTSKANGNSIFVPAAGLCYDGSVDGVGSLGYLWSSSLSKSYSKGAWSLGFNSDDVSMGDGYGDRYCGFIVRPVQNK